MVMIQNSRLYAFADFIQQIKDQRYRLTNEEGLACILAFNPNQQKAKEDLKKRLKIFKENDKEHDGVRPFKQPKMGDSLRININNQLSKPVFQEKMIPATDIRARESFCFMRWSKSS